MPQPLYFRFRTRPGLTGWARILIVLGSMIALALVVGLIAVGILLFVMPVLALTALGYYLLPKRRPRPTPSSRAQQPVIIDGEFRVVDAHERDPAALDDRTTGQ
jgi:hypothetical protein